MPHRKKTLMPTSHRPNIAQRRWSTFGEIVEGFDIPVFNEREVRASAGLLFILGFTGYIFALTSGVMQPLRGFGMIFMIDMTIRLVLSPRYSPTLALARVIGAFNAPNIVAYVMCGICLSILFFETAFGICVGCEIQQRFSRTPPKYCAGDSCNYRPLT
jgi:hypothetical protein